MTTNTNQNELVTTARIAGVWYLLMAVSGIFGFLIFHPKIFITGDPATTLQNIIDGESIARTRLFGKDSNGQIFVLALTSLIFLHMVSTNNSSRLRVRSLLNFRAGCDKTGL